MKSELSKPGNSQQTDYQNLLAKLSPEEVLLLAQNQRNQWPIQPNSAIGSHEYVNRPEPSILQQWSHILWTRKWIVIAVTLVASLLSAGLVYSAKPVYQAAAILEVGKENASLIQISKDLIVHNDDSTLKTKKFLLQSTPLLENVVVNLGLDHDPSFITNRRTWFLGGKESAKKTGGAELRAAQGPVTPQGSDEGGERLTLSEDSEHRSVQESQRLEPFVKVLEDNMTVEEIRDTRLLNVSFTHTDPVIAANVANGIVEALMQSSYDTKTERFNTASNWLERQTRELRTKVDQAERELADYTHAHNVISADGSQTVTADKLSRLHGEAMRAESDRILKQSLYREVQNGNVEQLPEAFTNPATVELKTKLNELTTKAAQLNVNYGPDNPQTIEVQQQIAIVQKQVDENKKMLEAKLKADYERAVRDEESIKRVVDQATAAAVQENQTGIRYTILKQQFDTSKALYADFIQKTNQANFEASQQNSNLRVIQPARVPKETKPPKRWQILILGLMLSLATGVAFGFIVDKLDTRIDSVEQLSRHLQLPALAVIPQIATTSFARKIPINKANSRDKSTTQTAAWFGTKSGLIKLNGQSPAAEAYRVLRTSVLLSSQGTVPKILLFTSSQPGDGKTTTAANTAVSLAQLGASVLLIDADLRTPKVHELFEVDQSPGLSTVLLGEDRVENVIRPLRLPDLSVLPSGPVPSNPSELVSSHKLREMLHAVSGLYDHVLIDSPPLINLSDPLILSTLVDGVILVVDGAKTTCDAALRAREELTNVGASIFGVVLNRFDSRRKKYGGYY